jgi:hypothetical protein
MPLGILSLENSLESQALGTNQARVFTWGLNGDTGLQSSRLGELPAAGKLRLG